MQSSWKLQALHTEMSIWDSTFVAQKLGLSFSAISRHILKIFSRGHIFYDYLQNWNTKNEKDFVQQDKRTQPLYNNPVLLIISLYIQQGHVANLRGFG